MKGYIRDVYLLNIKCLTCIMLYDKILRFLLSHQRAQRAAAPRRPIRGGERAYGWRGAKLRQSEVARGDEVSGGLI